MFLPPKLIDMAGILGSKWCHDIILTDWCTMMPVPFPFGFVGCPVAKSLHGPTFCISAGLLRHVSCKRSIPGGPCFASSSSSCFLFSDEIPLTLSEWMLRSPLCLLSIVGVLGVWENKLGRSGWIMVAAREYEWPWALRTSKFPRPLL